jgi:hypothetical protein
MQVMQHFTTRMSHDKDVALKSAGAVAFTEYIQWCGVIMVVHACVLMGKYCIRTCCFGMPCFLAYIHTSGYLLTEPSLQRNSPCRYHNSRQVYILSPSALDMPSLRLVFLLPSKHGAISSMARAMSLNAARSAQLQVLETGTLYTPEAAVSPMPSRSTKNGAAEEEVRTLTLSSHYGDVL